MKTQEVKDLHTKTVDELKKLLLDAKTAMFDLSMDLKQMKLSNTRSISGKRKEIAQILSVLRGKEIQNG